MAGRRAKVELLLLLVLALLSSLLKTHATHDVHIHTQAKTYAGVGLACLGLLSAWQHAQAALPSAAEKPPASVRLLALPRLPFRPRLHATTGLGQDRQRRAFGHDLLELFFGPLLVFQSQKQKRRSPSALQPPHPDSSALAARPDHACSKRKQ